MGKSIEVKIKEFSNHAKAMPGVTIIHEVPDFPVVYMSPRGLEELGTTLEELERIGPKYYDRYFNLEDAQDFIEKLNRLLTNADPDATFTFFQQVKFKDKEDWVWHVTATRIFHVDESGKPTHILSIAVPIDQMKHIQHKAERLLAENIFLKNNAKKFMSLGQRAVEILRLVALGKTSQEISQELHISVETVSTHRKIIKQKLGITNTYEFTEYALAFDLI